jgi:hypothetical protein
MSNHNISIKSIVRTSNGFTGTFAMSTDDIMVSTDGGKTFSRSSGTVESGVETIVYDNSLRPKINGTQGRRKEDAVEAVIGGKGVLVQWTQGHRGSVAAAFMAVWSEVGNGLKVGEAKDGPWTNPKGGRSSGGAAAAVNGDLIAKLEAQQSEMAELKAMLAAMMDKTKK